MRLERCSHLARKSRDTKTTCSTIPNSTSMSVPCQSALPCWWKRSNNFCNKFGECCILFRTSCVMEMQDVLLPASGILYCRKTNQPVRGKQCCFETLNVCAGGFFCTFFLQWDAQGMLTL